MDKHKKVIGALVNLMQVGSTSQFVFVVSLHKWIYHRLSIWCNTWSRVAKRCTCERFIALVSKHCLSTLSQFLLSIGLQEIRFKGVFRVPLTSFVKTLHHRCLIRSSHASGSEWIFFKKLCYGHVPWIVPNLTE